MPYSNNIEWVEFEDVEAINDTALAVQVVIYGQKIWIPLSEVSDDSEVLAMGDKGTLIITDLIAIEKGLS